MPFYRRKTIRPPSFSVTEADFNELNDDVNYLNGRLDLQADPVNWSPSPGADQPIHVLIANSTDELFEYVLEFPNSGTPKATRRLGVPINYLYDPGDDLQVIAEYYSTGIGWFAWELNVGIIRSGEDVTGFPKLAMPVRNVHEYATANKRATASITITRDQIAGIVSGLIPAYLEPMDGMQLYLGATFTSLGGSNAVITEKIVLTHTWIRLGGYSVVNIPGRVRSLSVSRRDDTTFRIMWDTPIFDDGSEDTSITGYEYNIGGDWEAISPLTEQALPLEGYFHDVTVGAGSYQVYVRAGNPEGFTLVPSSASVVV